MKEHNEQAAQKKEKQDRILDWIIGLVLLIAGITGVVAGVKGGHIYILWPILGLAGMSIFIDTFLKSKTIRIILNIIFAAALVVTFFIVRDFNGYDTTNSCQQQTILEQTNE